MSFKSPEPSPVPSCTDADTQKKAMLMCRVFASVLDVNSPLRPYDCNMNLSQFTSLFTKRTADGKCTFDNGAARQFIRTLTDQNEIVFAANAAVTLNTIRNSCAYSAEERDFAAAALSILTGTEHAANSCAPWYTWWWLWLLIALAIVLIVLAIVLGVTLNKQRATELKVSQLQGARDAAETIATRTASAALTRGSSLLT